MPDMANAMEAVTMKRVFLGLSAVAVIALLVAVAGAATGFQRSDCPGKIVCPLTGEEICKDECPRIDAGRDDCPGQVECPLDGKLVCRDQCPLADTSSDPKPPVRACCKGK